MDNSALFNEVMRDIDNIYRLLNLVFINNDNRIEVSNEKLNQFTNMLKANNNSVANYTIKTKQQKEDILEIFVEKERNYNLSLIFELARYKKNIDENKLPDPIISDIVANAYYILEFLCFDNSIKLKMNEKDLNKISVEFHVKIQDENNKKIFIKQDYSEKEKDAYYII